MKKNKLVKSNWQFLLSQEVAIKKLKNFALFSTMTEAQVARMVFQEGINAFTKAIKQNNFLIKNEK